MDFKSAAKQIQKGAFSPIYVCLGTERFLIEQFINYLMKKLIPPEQTDFSVTRFDMREVPLDVCLEDAETLPFMTEKKLIIAEHATFLTASRDKIKVEHDLNRLNEYIEQPAPFTVIVFIVEADKMDERKKAVKQLKKQGQVVEFKALDAPALRAWVQKQASEAGFELHNDGIEALLLNAGTDLHNLAAEIEKLSLYAGADQPVTPELIRLLTVRSTEQNVFLLVEEIVKCNLDHALSIYHDLLNRREEPIKLLMLIARQFRILLQAKEMQMKGYTNGQIAGQLGLHPYAVKVALDQGRSYSERHLNRILDMLAETDFRMKSGRENKEFALEFLIMKITHELTAAI